MSPTFAKLWALPCILVTVFCVVISFYPGCLNEDAIDQWGQAVRRQYVDWHPVTLSIVWTYLRYLYDGIQSMLVFQVLSFSAGLAMILRVGKSVWRKVLLFLAVVVTPPVFAFLGTIVKDTVMGCLLVLGIGAYYRYAEKRSRLAFCLAIFALYLAFAVRQNAIIAVAPILGLLFWQWLSPRDARASLIAFASVLVVTLFAFLGLLQITKIAFHAASGTPAQGLLLYDLATLSTESGRDLAPRSFERPGVTMDKIRSDINAYNGSALFWGTGRVYGFSEKTEDLKDLTRTWLAAIWSRPLGYFRWRKDVFVAFLGLGPNVLQPYIPACVVANTMGLAAADTPVHKAVMRWLGYLGQSLFFRCYCYLVLLIAIFAYGVWRRRIDIILISASGICYSLAYFFIIYQSTFRFACPTVFVAVVLGARITAEQLNAPSETEGVWRTVSSVDHPQPAAELNHGRSRYYL